MAQQSQGKMIRHVTGVDVVRSQGGGFALELELDGGIEEYLLQPQGEEINTLLRLFQRSGNVLLDMRTEELTFEKYGANE
jgi:hypothetical protein